MIENLCKEIDTNNLDRNLTTWLEEQAKNCGELKYLLAHAEDGVIWGRFDGGKLTTSNKVFPEEKLPELRLTTLQQCRIFGEEGEVLLWSKNKSWKARLIEKKTNVDSISEEQILWGTKGEKRGDFTLLFDGSEGLKHAVPFPLEKTDFQGNLHRPVRLVVRHYINYDASGVAKIFLSRLVELKKNGQND